MFLQGDVFLEPLIFNWHAWLGIFSPLSLGFELKNRYIKTLSSYLAMPDRHHQCANDPQLAGSKFVNLDRKNLQKAHDLYTHVLDSEFNNLQLAEDFYKFNATIQQSCHGLALQNAYLDIPESLSSCLELVYDLHNNPGVRILEPVLYQRWYSQKIQSVCISRRKNNLRPFVMSTPRFENVNSIILDIPFSDPIWDQLLAAKYTDTSINEFIEKLGIPTNKIDLFTSFFAAQPDIKCLSNSGHTKTFYLGHAAVLLQSRGLNILLDPLLTTQQQESCISMHGLPAVLDYVLITHAHQDHFSIECLLNLRHRIRNIVIPKNNNACIVDPSLKMVLLRLGFTNIIELEELDTINVADNFRITGLPFYGEHGDLDIRSKIAYKVDTGDKVCVFFADSKVSHDAYKYVLSKNDRIDELYIGMECKGAPYSWAYGSSFLTDISREQNQSRRLAGADASDVIEFINQYPCQTLYIYAMGMEPWLSHILGIHYAEDAVQLQEINKLEQFCLENGYRMELLKYEFAIAVE